MADEDTIDIDTTDNEGIDALQYTSDRDHKEVEKLLKFH